MFLKDETLKSENVQSVRIWCERADGLGTNALPRRVSGWWQRLQQKASLRDASDTAVIPLKLSLNLQIVQQRCLKSSSTDEDLSGSSVRLTFSPSQSCLFVSCCSFKICFLKSAHARLRRLHVKPHTSNPGNIKSDKVKAFLCCGKLLPDEPAERGNISSS